MSERIQHGHEHGKQLERLVKAEQVEKLERHKHEAAERAKKQHQEIDVNKLREQVSEQAKDNVQLPAEQTNAETTVDFASYQALKSDAYDHTLKHIQRQLPKRTRQFSRIAHSNIVENISEVSSKTIARPSGLLGGGVCAFLGSVVLTYYTRHYGFRYNYSFFIVCMIVGFMAGVVLEFGIRLLVRRHH